MLPYFYKVTNLINGKYYYGSGSKPLGTYYTGSSVLLSKAIEKYGIENFKFEVLREFETRKEAFLFEDRFLKFYRISEDANSYNLKDAGQGGDTIKNHPNKEDIVKKRNGKVSESLKGHLVSEETRRKIGEKKRGTKLTEETKKKLSEAAKKNGSGGNTYSNRSEEQMEETKKKLSEIAKKNGFGGDQWENLSDDEREKRAKKMSESRKGKKLSEETKRKISEKLKGHKLSEETREKISNTLKNK